LDPGAPAQSHEFSAFCATLLDLWLAVPEHHDLDDRLSVHRLFGSAADRSWLQRSRSRRFGFYAEALHQRCCACRLFRPGREQHFVLQYPINVPGGTGPKQGYFGTLGRNTFRGPSYTNFDIALIKDTPFGSRGGAELGTLEFRAEFFNIFNFVNFGLPSNVIRGSGFGYINKTAGTSRQIQFSLKVMF
jgi:hypothetical protein